MEPSRIKEQLVAWLQTQVRRAGAQGLVVGLSGGIDSAVVAALAKQACGDNVLGLILPCESQPDDERFARLTAVRLGVRAETITLDGVYQVLKNMLPPCGNRLAPANLKPRLRMTTLYYHAAMHNYLVAGTGNQTEIALGYFTKYGDGGVDLLPLGDQVKSEVRALAKELGVPQEIIDRTPTAGLYPGQTDEGEIGLSYDQLDRLVGDPQAREWKTIGPEKAEKIRTMMTRSEHKRTLPPVFLKNA
jgi:NAD+ synthase